MSAIAFPPSAKVRWLVEIHVKDWIPTVKNEDRILGYVEVDVPPDCDEFEARRTGFDVFCYPSAIRTNSQTTCCSYCGEC